MRITAFIEDHNSLDRIIWLLKLTFAAERPASTTGPAGAHDMAAEERIDDM